MSRAFSSNQPRNPDSRRYPGSCRRSAERFLFITITLLGASRMQLAAQQLTTQAPPAESPQTTLPDSPDLTGTAHFPLAHPLPVPPANLQPVLDSDTQTYADKLFTLTGNVLITYGTRRIRADRVTYNADSGEIDADGHLDLTDSANSEHIVATSGTYNLKTGTGRFTDVSGSVGVKPVSSARRMVYTTANPFLFNGSLLVKTGPGAYDIYDGTVTSCQLPHPDWLLTSGHFAVADGKVRGTNSVFHLVSIPVFYLPYVTAPTDAGERQSGFVIPTLSTFDKNGNSGVRFGDQYYLVLGRSADLTVGVEDYTSIGSAQNATFRYKGPNLDFATVHYDGLLDSRDGTANQGGEEFTLAGRHDFTHNTRAAANIDYLSSYIYREAFTDTFNQAVTSDIVSSTFISRVHNGFELTGLADRYQGIKTIAQTTTSAGGVVTAIPQSQVRIFHAPSIDFNTTDHLVPHTATRFSNGAELELESSAAGLKRSQPTFVTGGIIERFDFHPQLSYPVFLGRAGSAWHLLPVVAARETLYTRSRAPNRPGQPPTESLDGLARSDFEFAFNVRPPVLERTFAPPPRLRKFFGVQLRHTLEPELTYRLTTGVERFARVLRFDATDVVSNTNEAEYGVTQRLFRRVRNPGPCLTEVYAAESGFSSTAPDDPGTPPGKDVPIGSGNPNGSPAPASVSGAPASAATTCNRSEALISWRLTQKYFFDPGFGGAVVNSRRNIFQTTLDLSGIAFLTEPRNISPLVSRLRVRTSAHTDVEWDFDLDTGARKFTSSNVYFDLHQGEFFSALSYARLDAPGRFFTQNPDTSTATTGVSSAISDFNQLRFLIGYGNPAKPGLSLAANTGLDLKSLYGTASNSATANGVTSTTTVFPALLQYATVQTSYNFNCCGFSVEYRKFELGSVRNEGSYKFSFTLANIGTAGNLRRAERLF